MRGKSGREMKNLSIAVSVSVLVLLLAIIAYFLADVTVTTNKHIEDNKERMIQESVRLLSDLSQTLDMSSLGPKVIRIFNQEIIQQISRGDYQALYSYAVDVVTLFFPVSYVGIMVNGELVSYGGEEGLVIHPEEMLSSAPQGEYLTMDRLGDREGFFVSVFFPIDLSILGVKDFTVNMVVDRTQELADIENYFKNQRNSLVLRMSIISVVALMLSLLLTTVGLRHFTRKYVVNPIEELNLTAQKITDGSFEGEVRVDEKSAYAALQGLLQSGQKVLSKMDEEMKE